MTVLEFRDVQHFSMVELHGGETRSFRISGLAFHSALAVKDVERVREGNTLKVRILLGLARAGMSGHFDVTVEVPKDVREIVFGDERHVIWTEPTAPPQ